MTDHLSISVKLRIASDVINSEVRNEIKCLDEMGE